MKLLVLVCRLNFTLCCVRTTDCIQRTDTFKLMPLVSVFWSLMLVWGPSYSNDELLVLVLKNINERFENTSDLNGGEKSCWVSILVWSGQLIRNNRASHWVIVWPTHICMHSPGWCPGGSPPRSAPDHHWRTTKPVGRSGEGREPSPDPFRTVTCALGEATLMFAGVTLSQTQTLN